MYSKPMSQNATSVYNAERREIFGLQKFTVPPPPYPLIGSMRQEFKNQTLEHLQVMKMQQMLPQGMQQFSNVQYPSRIIVSSQISQATIISPTISQFCTYSVPRPDESIYLSNASFTPTVAYNSSSNNRAAMPSTPVASTFDFSFGSCDLGNRPTDMLHTVSERECSSSSHEMASGQHARQSSDWDHLLAQLQDMQKIALEGCKKAEALAACHQKRPCFKKIDSLCARLKQDLLKPDNVMSNINSQGLAWAVKDFIFVFTRIMNAWIIIKGYVSCKSEGLLSIQRELCPNFMHAFGRWHGATHELVQSLIKSFINLNKLAKSQRCGTTNFSKTDETMSSYNDDELSNDPFDDPAEADLATGTYYRTGIYTGGSYNRTAASAPPGFEDSVKFAGRKHDSGSNDGKAPKPRSSKTGIGSKRQTVLFDTSDTSEISAQTAEPLNTSDQPHLNTATKRIDWVLDEVRAIEEAQYFYCITFSKNYFPDFHLVASNPLDLRAIYKKNEMGRYSMLLELLEDLRMVLRNCSQYIEASTAFDLWNPMQELEPGQWKTINRQEFENFPKMITFVKKMERLLDMVREEAK